MFYPVKWVKGYLEVRRIAKTEKTREEQAKKKYGWDGKCRQCNKWHHADEAFCSAEYILHRQNPNRRQKSWKSNVNSLFGT